MMRKMVYTLFLAILLVVVVGNVAQASIKIEDFYTTTSIFDITLLICALICLLWSLRIMSLVRGGLMSKSWQMFVLGFGFLVIAQVFSLGENARLFLLPGYITSALYLLMAIMWLSGLYKTRRILG
jgi:hypothetical protein